MLVTRGRTRSPRRPRGFTLIELITAITIMAVLAGLAAANHDPEQFPNPEIFDICRDPNRHLSFGQAIHYCVGAPLARMEGQIAFSLLLERLPELRLSTSIERIEYRPNMFLRGIKALPLKI